MIEPVTERLTLRQWTSTDREPFAQLNADPEVMRYFPRLLERAQSDELAEKLEAIIGENGWGFWAVETKADKRFVGFTGLHRLESGFPFAPCVEIGWRLAKPYWGMGYATEAAIASLNAGFSSLGLEEIVSFTTIANARSRAVMERLGMTLDLSTFEHPALPQGHALREHCLYRLQRSDYWRSQQSATGE